MTKDNSPGMVWRPSAHQPKHAAQVHLTEARLWHAECPACRYTGESGTHAAAMIDALNHRKELG